MNNPIFGILNEQDSGMLLLSKLEGLERKQGPFEEVGIATLKAGRIRTCSKSFICVKIKK